MYKMNCIRGAEDAFDEITLDDKIKEINNDFDYLLDGIGQLPEADGNGIVDRLAEVIDQYIGQVAMRIADIES